MSHRRKDKKKENYYLEDWNSMVCCNKTIKENRTVYVDIKYGNENGELNQPKCPFNSINRAINAIRNIPKTVETQWLIKVNPGFYNEIVDVPLFINIKGAGVGVTSIKSIYIGGTSQISNLSIVGNTLPLIKTSLDNQEAVRNNIKFDNIRINADGISNTNNNSLISINGNGINNIVLFEATEITATILKSNPATSNQILFDVNASLQLTNTSFNIITDYKAPTTCFNINSKLIINGGTFNLFVNDGPSQEVNMFKLATAGLNILNNTSSITIGIISNSYKADVSYIKANGYAIVTVSNSTAFLDGVSRDFCNLVENLNSTAQIDILSLTTPMISVPRIKGFKESVKYVAISGDGDLVANGGFYGNIITVNSADFPDGYFLKENDFTVLSNGTNVHVFDPSLADEVVTDKGKIINITNIG
jgi:hypothetical protein